MEHRRREGTTAATTTGLAPLVAALLIALSSVPGCDPEPGWPSAGSYFPYVYTAVEGLEPYEEVRWETGEWDVSVPEVAALYIYKALYLRPGAPTEEVEHFALMRPQIPPLGDGLRLTFVGDIMRVGGNWAAYALPSESLLDGDYRIGNLETPTSTDHSIEQGALGLYAFNSPPEMLDGLPVDLLQLNNNHSLDADDLGLENTIAECEARGIEHTGVDGQALIDIDDGQGDSRRVAFLAYTWGVNDGRRSENGHELHIVPFGELQGDAEISLDLVATQIAEAQAAGARTIVVMVHWGFEYELYPDPHFMVLARRIIALGADLIVGQGPHVVQPPEICHVNDPDIYPGIGTCSLRTDDGRPRNAAVLYSLGDFGALMPNVAARVGLVATVSVDDSGVTGLGWRAVASVFIDREPFVVPLAEATDDEDFAEEEVRLRAHVGEGWERP